MENYSEKKIQTLLDKMTTKEKIGQLNQLSPSIVGGFDVTFEELIEMATSGRISQEEFHEMMEKAERDFHEDKIRAGEIGSFLLNDPVKADELQRIAVEDSRCGIPLIFGFDVIHGHRTVFPIPLAEACSWDETGFELSAKIAAEEAKAMKIHWAFAPMVDISRDARWGRIAESPGEDPFLASVYARAKVRGFQQEDKGLYKGIAACAKHFAAYGAAESGQDYNTVALSDSLLRNIYLPPFKAAAEAGAMTFMAAFNDLNGIPCTVNSYLLDELLRKEWGFGGFVVSDANGVRECVIHGIAADDEDAARSAVSAGVDMDMGSRLYSDHLGTLIETGELPMEVLDEAVRRVLRIKSALGLFEDPYLKNTRAAAPDDEIPAEYLASAREIARKSIVLLKNEGILPLRKKGRIALIGELADMPAENLGAWAIAGRGSDCVSLRQGFEDCGADFKFAGCCGPGTPFSQEELDAVVKDAEVIVAVVGETTAMSGEASSRADISLPGEQREMLEAALRTGLPVVAVLMNGRPLALSWEGEHLPAILETWQLGVQGGHAITDVLFGNYNPSGKLCCTFPAVTGQCPRYYNHFNTGRPASKAKFTSRYLDAPLEPLYPFGYGLSYTSFEYKESSVKADAESVTALVKITNTGAVAGEETVQLYIRDKTASLVRPVKELKAFKKVLLQPGETVELELKVSKQALGFYNNQGEYILEDGTFIFYVGGDSVNCLQQELEVAFTH